MPAGRPSTYTQEMLDMCYTYIQLWEGYIQDGIPSTGDAIPSHVNLCRTINRGKTTIYHWEKEPDKVEFRNILEKISELQESVLFNESLRGDYNSNIAKLALGKHGYKDMQETSRDPAENMTLEEINARVGTLLSRPEPE